MFLLEGFAARKAYVKKSIKESYGMRNKDNKLIYFDEYKNINGIEQCLLHAGTSYDNPVMLFLHCSGFPESMLEYTFQKKWEDIFTIVNLDQRGTGKTFTRNPDEIPTVEILIEDIHKTVSYLKEKYKKNKIIIVGHSLGTMLGSIYISKYPDDVSYYIGTGQVVDFKSGEHRAFEVLKDIVSKNNDQKALNYLEKLGDDFPGDRNGLEYTNEGAKFKKLEQKYKMIENCFTFSMLKDFLMSPIFKWSDVSAINNSGKVNETLVDETINFNIRNQSDEYNVPVYFIMGENDWQTPYYLAKEYFDEIKSPDKKFYTIQHSGHLAVMEKQDLFYDMLAEIKYREDSKSDDGIFKCNLGTN